VEFVLAPQEPALATESDILSFNDADVAFNTLETFAISNEDAAFGFTNGTNQPRTEWTKSCRVPGQI
jgi:hypothetical protein